MIMSSSPKTVHRNSFRADTQRFVILRLMAVALLPGLAVLTITALLGAKGMGLMAAALCLGATAALLAVPMTRRLADLLSSTADTLASIGQLKDDTAPSVRPAGSFQARIRTLEQAAVRAMQERLNRLSDLQRARDAAQAESVSRSAFISGVGHELRTPLNAIIGYAMLLSEDMAGRGEDDMARDMDRILVASRRLLRLINNILDFSRLDSGTTVVERSALDVRAVTSLVAAESGLDTCPLETSVSPSAALMIGDEAKLRQILTCLLGSITTASSCDVRLAVDTDPAHDSRICFTFSGTGLSAAALRGALNEDKSALPAAVTTATLAASVVRRLAALLDGEINVTADEASVRAALSLPRNGGIGEAGIPDAERLPPSASQYRPDATRTVLVIDDDADTIALMDRWLSDRGYHVLSAITGSEGLALAHSHRPDFIILDVFMPGKSGYDVLKELRADAALKSIPVIIASSDDNRVIGLEAGAAEVLVKPLAPGRIADVIRALSEPTGGNILVVDDEADSGELVRRYGHMAGMNVRIATNIDQGLAAARTERPDAIVLDLCFPDADGFAMIEALAKDDGLRKVPVMILSQFDISPEQHMKINSAGHHFHAKWKTSPSDIVANLKTLVAH
jgi:DNA-binding response OmpR family regulator/signal transduction histidine kinase